MLPPPISAIPYSPCVVLVQFLHRACKHTCIQGCHRGRAAQCSFISQVLVPQQTRGVVRSNCCSCCFIHTAGTQAQVQAGGVIKCAPLADYCSHSRPKVELGPTAAAATSYTLADKARPRGRGGRGVQAMSFRGQCACGIQNGRQAKNVSCSSPEDVARWCPFLPNKNTAPRTFYHCISPSPAHSFSRCITALHQRSIRHPKLCTVGYCCNSTPIHCCRCFLPATAASRRCCSCCCICFGAAAMAQFCFCVFLPVTVTEGVLCEKCIICCA